MTADHAAALVLDGLAALGAETDLAGHHLPLGGGGDHRGQQGGVLALFQIFLQFDHLFDDPGDGVRAGSHLQAGLADGGGAADALQLVDDGVHVHAGAQGDRDQPGRGRTS